MNAAKLIAYSPYGAFELKRCYQKNIFLGTLVSGLTALAVIAAFTLAAYVAGLNAVPLEGSGVNGKTEVKLTEDKPPSSPPIGENDSPLNIEIEGGFILEGVIPNPVEDYNVLEVRVMASKNDKLIIGIDQHQKGLGYGTGGGIDTAGLFGYFTDPQPTDFIPVDENPVLLDAPVPAYPEMARKAGIEAVVWIMVLVDTEGNVKDAIISKPSDRDLGFDEAALAAAWKRKYRPAMQNDQPVAVWISYKVKFEIGN